MTASRRRLLQSMALSLGAAPAAAQSPDLTTLRAVSAAHGLPLTDDRLRALAPVLARRQSALRALREFEADDRLGI